MARRRHLATAGLVALLVVDIALVALAMRNPFRGASTAAVAAPTGVVTSTGATPTGATSTPVVTGGGAGSGSLTIVPFDADRAWRFQQGSCRGGAALSVTTNGGRTWRTVDSPLPAVTRLIATDDNKVQVIGADEDCQTTSRRSTDGGQTWAAAAVPSTWHRPPAQPAQLITSSGRTVTPCASGTVSSAESLSATAAQVLCSTGKLVETADGGSSWVEVARGIEVLGIDDRLVGGRIAAEIAYRNDACAGLQVATLISGAVTKLACVELTPAQAAAAKIGSVALATREDQLWLQVGDSGWLSGDGGKTVTAW